MSKNQTTAYNCHLNIDSVPNSTFLSKITSFSGNRNLYYHVKGYARCFNITELIFQGNVIYVSFKYICFTPRSNFLNDYLSNSSITYRWDKISKQLTAWHLLGHLKASSCVHIYFFNLFREFHAPSSTVHVTEECSEATLVATYKF